MSHLIMDVTKPEVTSVLNFENFIFPLNSFEFSNFCLTYKIANIRFRKMIFSSKADLNSPLKYWRLKNFLFASNDSNYLNTY